VLVYSTCTISPDENERLIAAFLDSNPDFRIDDLTAERPSYGAGASLTSTDAVSDVRKHSLLTLPHRDRTAGFFIARLRRS
jgi:16S rRNA (cytosine967-C5)-methyltransferase